MFISTIDFFSWRGGQCSPLWLNVKCCETNGVSHTCSFHSAALRHNQPFFPIPQEKKKMLKQHTGACNFCFLRAWEGSWQPFHNDRSTTAHSAKCSELHQNSRLQMEDLLQQQTGRSWKETPGTEEGTLWWEEVRFRKRAADRCPVKPTSSFCCQETSFVYYGLILIMSTTVLY